MHTSSIENYTNTLVAVGGPSFCCEVLAFLYDCCAGPILLPRDLLSCSLRLRDFRFTGFSFRESNKGRYKRNATDAGGNSGKLANPHKRMGLKS